MQSEASLQISHIGVQPVVPGGEEAALEHPRAGSGRCAVTLEAGFGGRSGGPRRGAGDWDRGARGRAGPGAGQSERPEPDAGSNLFARQAGEVGGLGLVHRAGDELSDAWGAGWERWSLRKICGVVEEVGGDGDAVVARLPFLVGDAEPQVGHLLGFGGQPLSQVGRGVDEGGGKRGSRRGWTGSGHDVRGAGGSGDLQVPDPRAEANVGFVEYPTAPGDGLKPAVGDGRLGVQRGGVRR
jgi:hypothetical protein